MNELLRKLSLEERDKINQSTMPAWTAPMQATLTEERFSSDDWLYERKLDGERCVVFHDGRGVKILSRNRQCLNDTYPELVEALSQSAPWRFIADGEIVAFEGNVTSFARLQQRMRIRDANQARASKVKVHLYVFDLLYLDGYELIGLPLRSRKGLLRSALGFKGPLRFTPHRNGDGEAYYREACQKGWEGIIAKRALSRYSHSRSRDWLKFKCVHQQELVIGGYTEPTGRRKGFGALLLGFYRGNTLHYAGKVGAGFDEDTLQYLSQKMRAREQKRCPFKERDEAARGGVHWINPTLVAEIGFTEWTDDERLRHPRFLGLRDDKSPQSVVKETPQGSR